MSAYRKLARGDDDDGDDELLGSSNPFAPVRSTAAAPSAAAPSAAGGLGLSPPPASSAVRLSIDDGDDERNPFLTQSASSVGAGAGASAVASAPPGVVALDANTPSASAADGDAAAAAAAAGKKGCCTSFWEGRQVCVSLVHLFFRVSALLVYLFGTIFRSVFDSSFVVVFVVIVVMLACDFWVVKNYTGRKLVGLRWWSEILEDGSTRWRFESIADPKRVKPADSRLFWITLYGTIFAWALFALSCIFTLSFSWLLIVGIALVLNVANVVGYTKSQKDARQRFQQVAGGMLMRAAAFALTRSNDSGAGAGTGANQA